MCETNFWGFETGAIFYIYRPLETHIPEGQTGIQTSLRKSRCVTRRGQLSAFWPLKLAELLTQYKSLSYSRRVVSRVPSPPMIFAWASQPFLMRGCERVTTQPQTGTAGQISTPHFPPAMQSSCVFRGEDTSLCLSAQDVPKLSSSCSLQREYLLWWIRESARVVNCTELGNTQNWENLDMMGGLCSLRILWEKQNYIVL